MEELEKALVEGLNRDLLVLAYLYAFRKLMIRKILRGEIGMGEFSPPEMVKDEAVVTERAFEAQDLLFDDCVEEQLEVNVLLRIITVEGTVVL